MAHETIRMRLGLGAACLLTLVSACDPVEDDELLLTDATSPIMTSDASGSPDAAALDGSVTSDGASDGASDAALVDAGRDAAATDASSGDATVGDAASGDPYESLRQVCVDTINAHRATLNLAPLMRASKAQETCSDKGAKADGDSKMAHGSAGSCSGLGAQNTCPSWKFGPGTGNATLEAALKRCLQQMWDEGMPPVSVKACIADPACFPKYGHWINMSSTSSRVVACGFYDMGKNTFWMNQDFGR